jgi:hypothetical protein
LVAIKVGKGAYSVDTTPWWGPREMIAQWVPQEDRGSR